MPAVDQTATWRSHLVSRWSAGRQAWGLQIILLFVLVVLKEVGRLNVDVKLPQF